MSHTRFPLRLLTAVAAATLLAACSTLAPDYERPVSVVPDAWAATPAAATATTAGDRSAATAAVPAVDTLGWQEFIADDKLRRVIALALRNNRDLRVSTLNVERLQALYQVQRADLMPSINAGVGQSAQRTPGDLNGTGQSTISRQYSGTVGISAYELDLFGRVRSLKDAALMQYLATEQAQRSAQISLVSQVSVAYMTLAADRERLSLAEQTLQSRRETLRLTQRMHELGVSSALELRQVQSTVDSARADVASYSSVVAQDLNALTVLVGAPVASDLLPTAISSAALTLTQDLSAGLPSDVLLRRPDVQQAEKSLEAANANIGAARAAFFPSISLTASTGYASTDLNNLFKSDQRSWSFVPQLNIPIFSGGRNRANLRVSELDRDIAVAQYEKAIQTAFKEVSDALAQRATLGEQTAAQEALAASTLDAFRLARARYEKGIDDYLSTLDAQRSSYTAQQALISARLAQQVNRVTVYKVLGGGASQESAAAPVMPKG
ncbi:efflux transporter outer membrane subunit [Hylemonella gracilis]|uniref:RND family efflux pump outer membrane lipoprotein n=1 Tax=Hylemonella gracilis ATCC 19624 TaxID=887062 RepID=F3KXA3_9BURK|nr:efflux transporter outer membrane subunit [Hylemonella gracilis]EGI75583.1 RND family efflux pump outer membrane lipoprotein [Hylemonella gracilis ATCC 19624]